MFKLFKVVPQHLGVVVSSPAAMRSVRYWSFSGGDGPHCNCNFLAGVLSAKFMDRVVIFFSLWVCGQAVRCFQTGSFGTLFLCKKKTFRGWIVWCELWKITSSAENIYPEFCIQHGEYYWYPLASSYLYMNQPASEEHQKFMPHRKLCLNFFYRVRK